jgi:hypothetical protein
MTTDPHDPGRQPGHGPITQMAVSMTGAGGSEHETEPPGAAADSVRAGHEPDKFEVRGILYVPAVVVIVLILAYLLVTGLFSYAMSKRSADEARAKQENPQVVELTQPPHNDRVGRTSSTEPEQLRDPQGRPLAHTGVPQPRLEGVQQTLNDPRMPGNDPSSYRSKLPDPEGNNPVWIHPEDLRPENYVSRFGDPVLGQKILARFGWADEGKKLARVPIDEAIKLAAEKKLKLPVRKDPVKLPDTSAERAKLSNAGRGEWPPAPAAEPKKDGDQKNSKQEKK